MSASLVGKFTQLGVWPSTCCHDQPSLQLAYLGVGQATSAQDCELACAQSLTSCTAFSHSRHRRDCFLCSKCAVPLEAGKNGSAVYHSWVLTSSLSQYTAVLPPVKSLCAAGLRNVGQRVLKARHQSLNPVCCNAKCTRCGGQFCERQPLGRSECCTPPIRARRRWCENATDVSCILQPPLDELREGMRRALYSPPQGFRTCAVVGSSGSLLSGRFGPEIDAHEAIIRFNNAPVVGFEQLVGSRTTIRFVNSQAILALLGQCTPSGRCEPNPACCPR
jgi:hypothetical protein